MWRARPDADKTNVPINIGMSIITAFQWEYKCTLRIVGQLAFRASKQPLFRQGTFYLGSRG